MGSNGKIIMGVGIVVLLGVGAAAAMLARKQKVPEPTAPARDTTAVGDLLMAERTKGSPTAPITIYEFSDFQCPYCRQFWATTLPALEREYIATKKARFIFINFPIMEIHPNARAAHHLAMCGARQNKFWPVHDLLYQHQKDWEKLANPAPYFRRLGDSASLEPRALATCTQQQSEDWLIQAEANEAGRLGLAGTPAFVINGGLLPGAQPLEVWRPILDSIYRTAEKEGNRD
ncbi:MAG: DsbA family protein [Gemmatimonadetes bacterium]|nr:DsbA family protein [Gemmatimonadota bacterium]